MTATLTSFLLVFVWSTLFIACDSPSEGDRRPSDGRPLAFSHITVIDGTGAPAQPDMTVIVSGNRVSGLGKYGAVPIPEDALIVDATNQFMIPGLWDMHQHAIMRKNKFLPLLTLYLDVANGVTGVRDLGDQGQRDDFGDFPYVQDFEWRQAITAGAVIGPRLVLSGVIVDGPKPGRAGWASAGNDVEARRQVLALKRLGADFVKVVDGVPRDAYFALIDEARKQGIHVAGHVPRAISAAEASDAGQKSIEHLSGILLASSTRGSLPGRVAEFQALLDSYSDERASALFSKFVKNGTYSVPTLALSSQGVNPIPAADPRIARYLSPALQEDYANRLKETNPNNLALQKARYHANQRLVAAMHRAGVKSLTGTDTWWSFGFGVHDELAELVKAGLTPMEALQTATKNPAEYLGKLDSMGTVEVGKLADLVLLDANPLEAIGNTQKIRAVVVDGRLLDRMALDRMLAQVEAAAQN